MTSEFLAGSPEETERIARDLATRLGPSDVVYLRGNLGAGKTCFARGLARGLGAAAAEVASPTFALINEYAAPDGAIVMRHVDLYRLADRTRDLEAVGIPDALSGAPIAVEWPGAALAALLAPTVEVEIEWTREGERRIRIRRAEDSERGIGSG